MTRKPALQAWRRQLPVAALPILFFTALVARDFWTTATLCALANTRSLDFVGGRETGERPRHATGVSRTRAGNTCLFLSFTPGLFALTTCHVHARCAPSFGFTPKAVTQFHPSASP